MRLAFVDLETTGATAAVDRITEVGVVEIDGDTVREWSTLVNPDARISEFIERLTGISNAMVADAPRFEEIAAGLRDRLDGCLFVAHNARFDYGFLKAEFARVGIDFRATVLCTVKLSRRLFPQHRKHNLDSLIERHGLRVDQRHRALGDARAIAQFWQALPQDIEPEVLDAAVHALTARPTIPAYLDEAQVDALPEGSGVYLMYGENELPLYVGKSKTIKKRVLAHFAGDLESSKERDLVLQVRRIEAITTAGEVGALLLEAQLVKRLQPVMNRQLRRNDETCSWQLDFSAEKLQPQLVMASTAGYAQLPDLFGLFKSPRDAKRALQALVDEHGLCAATLGVEPVRPGSPCFAHQVKKCRGACVGKESPQTHAARVAAALGKLKLTPWPFHGPAALREGEDLHLVDRWCYLGTVREEQEFATLLDDGDVEFDADIYRILVKVQAKLQPLTGLKSRRWRDGA